MRNIVTLKLAAGAVALAATVGTASAVPFAAVNSRNQFLTFDSATPQTVTTGKAITGLAQNESIEGIDFRPTTGVLYGLGSFGTVYTLSNLTGTGPVVATTAVSNVPINGTSFGFDFNPQADAAGANSLRIVSDQNQNLAVNVDSGGVLVATPVFYPNGRDPGITGEAYTNSAPGGTTAANPTVQYAIDSSADQLVLQAFNAGQLTVIGGLGVDTTDRVGFDIFSPVVGTNTGYAALSPVGSNRTNLYLINLATGEATFINEIGSGQVVPNISAFPAAAIPEPTAMAVLGLGGLALVRRRRA